MIEQFLKLKYGVDFYKEDYQELLKSNEAEITKLVSGMPLHKVLGYIDLANIRINLKHHVLIPRYETEELVLITQNYLNKRSKVLDLGCGSGFIGLALKKAIGCDVTLSDIEQEAILQTRENALINGLEVKVIKSDLFNNIDETYDVIITNPPYIPTTEVLPRSVLKHEPSNALYAGEDGLKVIRKIIKRAWKYIRPHGYLLLEIHPSQAEFMRLKGFWIMNDLNQKERFAFKKKL